MKAVRGVRLSLLFALVVLVSLVVVPSAAAETSVGQLAPGTPEVRCKSDKTYDEVQTATSGGNSYVVPATGVLTSWSTNAAPGGGQSQGFKVFRPTGGGNFQVVGEDAPRTLTGGTVNTFAVNIPVQAGDVIGVLYVGGSETACSFLTGNPGDVLAYRSGSAPVGGTFTAEDIEEERRLNVSATLLPPPAITAIGPASGSVKGATVVITGANFAHVSGVSFGPVAAQSITVDSENQITAVSPVASAIQSVPVTVTTQAGTAASPQSFTYKGCSVPNLAGKKLKAAKKKLRKRGCGVGKVKMRGDATAKTGKVVKQNPKPGRLLAPGTKVKLVLAT